MTRFHSLLKIGIAVACALNVAQAAANQFRLGIAKDLLTLDPIASSDNPSIWTQLLIYDQLVKPSADGTKIEPGLADKWEISQDGKTYTFHLRENAKFSDGKPVTADDVIFSLKRAAGEKSGWARFFKPITGYEKVDDRTVKLSLDAPFTPMLNNLALFSASVLPAALLEQKGEEFFNAPIGSGPFSLKAWQKGQRVSLDKNPNYWQQGKPAVEQASLEIIGDDNARILKLKANELDAAMDIPFNQVAMLQNDPNIKTAVAKVFRTDLVQLNTSKKPFDDIRVRQALNYAINKQTIIQGVLKGNGEPAASSLPIMAHHNTDIKPYPYDLAKAKQLLAEAGLADGFKATLLIPSGDVTSRQVGLVIQNALSKIGVTIQVQTIESSSQFTTTKAGNYEMSLTYTTSDTIDPDQLIGFTAVNPERANALHTNWKSERVNTLYAEERKTAEGAERGRMFKEIEAIVNREAPFIFLYHQGVPYAYRSNIEGFKVLPTSNYRLEEVRVK
ncbi:MAG TPA: ABC transporter substrate-binding protein [Advenella sp.]|nr:ABC transporter substrate-binding protein [Advenella sp.]